MSNVTNKEIAAVFKEAKKYIARKIGETVYGQGECHTKTTFICVAIKMCAECGQSAEAIKVAERIIKTRLDGCFTLSEWLDTKLGENLELNYFDKDIFSKLQAHRIAWLDKLAQEFSNNPTDKYVIGPVVDKTPELAYN